ncbi:MAG: exosome complex protein Rrp42 [Candidatus Thermoplasmatota archaeon]|nr:exosome complex protein Rrp42 [Candidatus Thermoplasmatota archaeon]MBU1941306.1 exosome complex protein Rrp42 [Candidatus Thermoplasmatota archaeon]
MTLVPIIKRDYIVNLAKQGKRIDGRKFDQYRNIEIETNIIKKAEGSARVKLGNTQVLAGIKMDVGEPYPDSPDSGVMTTAAELIPLASPDFESGPPQQDAIELARVVDRGVRESQVIELDKLCIEPGEKVWIVFIDIHILDYDGNLFDAASIATLAALSTTQVPATRFELGEDYPLPIKEPPISCTSIKIDDFVMLDPILDEEEIADARLTVATDNNGDLRAMQKGLNGSFTREEIQKVIKTSLDNGQEIRKHLYKNLGK